ncbi:DUF1648 domain-containing protein [Rossellomorea marisflavi]|uniref:DUF1648 domain-containing protein n=1 Tax=Rossellomorea marisflavi TaxID=189381 RepID=UPI00203D9228|nr:DUF5808 domain-containing protein [Rossellomorea marisflavi]MCM2588487.1 DUF5808 domain-containing protein [Rossellomorea marisflavi]
MQSILLIGMIGIILLIQVMLPFIVKRTVVFGVTIPVEHIRDAHLLRFKKIYAAVTAMLSVAGIVLFYMITGSGDLPEDRLIASGILLPFIIIFISMSLYAYFHMRVVRYKSESHWFKGRRQVRVSELTSRSKDEMLPWYLFLFPIVIGAGLIVFTLMNYQLFPDQLPTHWGPNGEPDAFTAKTRISVLTMPFVLLLMSAMFLAIHELTRNSGIKLSAGNIPASKLRQFRLRKYSSWFLFFISMATTMLFSLLHIKTAYENLLSGSLMLFAPLAFSVLVFLGAVVMAVKVGKADSDLDRTTIIDEGGDTVNEDDDSHWIGGIFYFNREDPSFLVEKRFGVGWTINFARPTGYLLILAPVVAILLLTLL